MNDVNVTLATRLRKTRVCLVKEKKIGKKCELPSQGRNKVSVNPGTIKRVAILQSQNWKEDSTSMQNGGASTIESSNMWTSSFHRAECDVLAFFQQAETGSVMDLWSES